MVDTADAYQNEEQVGRAIRVRRDDVLLASKFGLVWRDEVDVYYPNHRSEKTPIQETVGASSE